MKSKLKQKRKDEVVSYAARRTERLQMTRPEGDSRERCWGRKLDVWKLQGQESYR
jgi:hypothetical protein